MNIFEITLDVDKRANKESVNLRQGDINGTTIKATLRDHDVPMEGGNYTAAFCMTLPDRKTYYWTEATYENGVVSVVVDEQYAANVPGSTNNAYFELYEGNELKYTTASFMVRIKASAMDGEAAGSYDSRVEAIMTEMQETIDSVTEAEALRQEAEGVRAANEEERIDTFEANEAQRSETFTLNEGTRAATFVETEGARSARFLDNEDERQQTFEANEQARIDEYTEAFETWTNAETERQNTFAANEQQRSDTFAANEAERQRLFDNFSTPTVSVEETSTGQVAHITWKDKKGTHVSNMVIDDAVNVTMTGDTFSVPVDPDGKCVESGTARFYFAGYVGSRMEPCNATITTTADSRFTVRITNSTTREQGLVRVEYHAGMTYPALVDVCTISFSCGGRTFLHRIEAIAPRGGAAVDGVSPTVSIDDTSTGHTIVITDSEGEHSYTVPTYAEEEAARQNAEDLRISAEGRRMEAETERASAEMARAETVGVLSDKLDAIMTRGPETEVEYLQRLTNDGNDISGNAATITSIHGRTLVWNQLVGDVAARVTSNGVTATRNADGSVTLSGTSTATALVTIVLKKNVCTIIANHRYLLRGGVAGGSSGTYYMNVSGLGPDYGNGSIFSYDSDVDVNLRYTFAPGVTFDNAIVWPQLFDLTRMFGAGNEPTTVAEFEALYPEPYYAYDAGSLLSVQMEGVGTTGRNLLRTTAQSMTVSGVTFTRNADGSFRAKGTSTDTIQFFLVQTDSSFLTVPAGTYVLSGCPSGGSSSTWKLDLSERVNGNLVDYIDFGAGRTFALTEQKTFQRCRIVIYSGKTVDMTFRPMLRYADANGEYEPHWSAQRAIDVATYFPNGMRSAGPAYDELTATEAVTRIEEVDLGNKTWNVYSSGQGYTYYANITDGSTPLKANGTNNIVCTEYEIGTSATALADGQMLGGSNNNRVYIRDDRYTTAADLKAALSGVMLFYELATPTTQAITPPLNLTYKAASGGTERVVVDETQDAPQSAPVPMDVTYDVSLIDNMLTLPEDYISHDSFRSFCEALEQAANLTITETWNDGTQRYDYSIVSNE